MYSSSFCSLLVVYAVSPVYSCCWFQHFVAVGGPWIRSGRLGCVCGEMMHPCLKLFCEFRSVATPCWSLVAALFVLIVSPFLPLSPVCLFFLRGRGIILANPPTPQVRRVRLQGHRAPNTRGIPVASSSFGRYVASILWRNWVPECCDMYVTIHGQISPPSPPYPLYKVPLNTREFMSYFKMQPPLLQEILG